MENFKKLFKCIGQYRKDVILTPLLVALEVVMDIIIPRIMADMIDYGITGGSMPVLVKNGLILLLMCVVSLISGALGGVFASRAAAGMAKNLRRKMYYKIQDFSFSNIDKFSSSGLVTRLTTDVTNVQNAFQMIIRIASRAPMMIVFSVIMAFSLNSRLALVFAAVIPVLFAGLLLILSRVTGVFTKVFKLYDKLNRVVEENLRGIRVVKSYVREDYEVQKFKDVSGEVYDNFVKAERILAFNSPLMQFCMYTCNILVCWWGAKLIVADSFTTGELMSLLTYAGQILMSLMMVSMVFVMITMSKASLQRIGELLEEQPDMKNADVTEVKDGSITFDKVSFGYRGKDGRACLKDISLTIPKGSTVGIIGGTGSGKSSLVQLIPRLYDATSGCVKVGGRDVREYDIEALRDEVAVVLQNNILFSGSIKDNIRWGKKDASDEEIARACRLSQAEEFISALPDGYDTWIEQGGNNVSGGQKQRLCIARALIKKPKILILDDSTSAVDTKTDALIQKAFSEEIPDTTKLIIAQRISSIQNADMIIVMDEGKISDIGKHNELLERSRIYREVYQSQQKGGLDDDAA